MESTSLIALSRADALRRQMDIVANNIANVSTNGFKAQRVLFQLDEVRPVPSQPLDFVIDRGTYRDLSVGAITQTGNPLDVALNGEGYLSVRLPNGETMYTRNGGFAVSTEGGLVDLKGNAVLGEGGSDISIPADAKNISIGIDGTVSTETSIIGKLQINEFANAQNLKPYGDNYYRAEGAEPLPNANTRVMQGAIEGSNVRGVAEMTSMMEITRAYQSVQKILESEHERVRNAISKIVRVS